MKRDSLALLVVFGWVSAYIAGYLSHFETFQPSLATAAAWGLLLSIAFVVLVAQLCEIYPLFTKGGDPK